MEYGRDTNMFKTIDLVLSVKALGPFDGVDKQGKEPISNSRFLLFHLLDFMDLHGWIGFNFSAGCMSGPGCTLLNSAQSLSNSFKTLKLTVSRLMLVVFKILRTFLGTIRE